MPKTWEIAKEWETHFAGKEKVDWEATKGIRLMSLEEKLKGENWQTLFTFTLQLNNMPLFWCFKYYEDKWCFYKLAFIHCIRHTEFTAQSTPKLTKGSRVAIDY